MKLARQIEAVLEQLPEAQGSAISAPMHGLLIAGALFSPLKPLFMGYIFLNHFQLCVPAVVCHAARTAN